MWYPISLMSQAKILPYALLLIILNGALTFREDQGATCLYFMYDYCASGTQLELVPKTVMGEPYIPQ
jgi:hypothetical protein